MSAPHATTWLTYRGDVTAGATVGMAMGPNTLGETLWVVSAVYDPQADRTRVGLTYMSPAGWGS